MAKCREERSSRRPPIKPLAQYLVVFVRGSILRNAVWPSAQNHMFAGMTHSGPNDLCVSHVSPPGIPGMAGHLVPPIRSLRANSVVLGNTIDIAVSGAQRMRGFASKMLPNTPKNLAKRPRSGSSRRPCIKHVAQNHPEPLGNGFAEKRRPPASAKPRLT